MQWKQMDWPILVDAQNELEVEVVPITLFLDEYGIIRKVNPSRRNAASEVEEFLSQSFAPPTPNLSGHHHTRGVDLDRLRPEKGSSSVTPWRIYGRALVDWGGADRLNDAVKALETAVGLDSDHGLTHFQLGVAHRRRWESSHRQDGDFQQAVNDWGQALAINPNQYIWRRRIQQFGPRLIKPYPFYDWVAKARIEIAARGDVPVKLAVEPSGAEVAFPSRAFESADTSGKDPDPEGRIHRDTRGFILVESTVVPAQVKPGGVVRVHLRFRPNDALKAHWNNEAEPMSLWVEHPDGGVVVPQIQSIANPDSAVSGEERSFEFEVRVPDDISSDILMLSAYALYNVCEDVAGKCLYRRQDIPIRIRMHSNGE